MLKNQKGRACPVRPAGWRQVGFAPIILIVALVVLVGTGVFVWRSQKNSTTPSSTPSPTLPTNIPAEAKTLVQLAINEAAKQALVDPSKVQIISVEKMEWSDGSLGCPKPGMAYTQAIVSGYLITLEVTGRRLEYHTDNGQLLELCSQSQTSDISSWKTFTTPGINSGLMLKYPQNWYFKDYEPATQKAHALYQNEPFDSQDNISTKDGLIFGEIKVMTTEAIRGLEWAKIKEPEFYNPNSDFWLKGSGIGGGPGFTQDIPTEIKLGSRRAILQRTYPDKSYEFVYPDQITNNYYAYLGNSSNEVLMISLTYDQKNPKAKNDLDTFDQILSTFKFTN
ncbi:hypothetical protein HYW46_02200 [Candidatus Daviesbacteria bacterium]|nr:hypothetical protein [Candidatus Daviesbacteria bacterium]